MTCLDCGAEMEQGTAECVGAGFESWHEFTSEAEKKKKEIAGLLTRQTITIPSTLAEQPARNCLRCRKVLIFT